MKNFLLLLFTALFTVNAGSQELQARLSVLSNQVSTKVDKRVFQTLQTSLLNILNNRKWTSDTYQAGERIKCNFLVNINEDLGENVFKASLTIQVARPVYNSSYETSLINFIDNDLVFRYVESQPVEFNENRIQGNDPLAANLTAVLAYYVNIILGIDYDSFSARGGDAFFLKAQNIVNNAPEGRDISGWKTFDGVRNRYRLIENILDSRFALVHEAIYSYYRKGLDLFYEDENAARTGILSALNNLKIISQENPNSMLLQFFFQGKSAELVRVFSRASPEMKAQAREILTRLDATNASAYKELR